MEKLDKAPVDFNVLSKIFAEAGSPMTESEIAYAKQSNMLKEPEVEQAQEDGTEDITDTDNADDVGETATDTAGADIVEEDEEQSTEDVPTKTDSKTLSKADKKIIAMKNAMKEKNAELEEVRRKLSEYESKKQLVEFEEEYGKTLDADTASVMAKSRLALEQQNRQLELLNFKIDNANVLRQYNVMEEAQSIMEKSKAASMTAEQYCRGIYGDTEPLDVKRSKAGVKGQLPSTTNKADYAVANANSNSITKANSKLSDQERTLARRLEELGFAPKPDEIKNVRKGL
jgi:hypothetical protein